LDHGGAHRQRRGGHPDRRRPARRRPRQPLKPRQTRDAPAKSGSFPGSVSMTFAAARDDVFPREAPRGTRAWHALLYVFLVFVFVTGGSSQERGWTDAIAELAALPVLAFACWRLAGQAPSRVRAWGLIAMAAVALLPWLQL